MNLSRRSRSSENLFVGLLVETDDQRFALAKRGSAQVAGGTEQQFLEGLRIRLVFLEIHVHDLLAFRHVHLVDLLHQGQRIISLKRGLPGVYFFGCFNLSVRKKLLRFSTALSALPMVTPIDF